MREKNLTRDWNSIQKKNLKIKNTTQDINIHYLNIKYFIDFY